RNLLSEVRAPGDTVTKISHDIRKLPSKLTDPEDHTTAYTRDDMGMVLTRVSPDSGTTRYTYDQVGNLQTRTTTSGKIRTYGHDALGRPTLISHEDPAQNLGFSYDAGTNGKGRLTGETGDGHTRALQYDPNGNLTSDTRTINGVAFTTQYAYDPAGTLIGMTWPDGRSLTFN
ncbi:MAG: RHS repeat protein, partial [Desulfobacterales bacterium]|nr:RHS repeat protein [Desulfobacterales bacterium]